MSLRILKSLYYVIYLHMKITLNLNTILYTYAPSGSGKSFFCKNVIIKQLTAKYPHLKITYLSSDDIRRDFLGENAHKYDPKMGKVSKKTFERIYDRVNVESSYPNNSDLIIVDTIGIGKDFRDKLTEIAVKNNYQTHSLVFQYTDQNDYYKYNDLNELNCKTIINSHLKNFKENLSSLRSNTMSVISSKDFSGIEVNINQDQLYSLRLSTVFDLEEIPIVGDVHGCIDELKEVINQNPNKKIILVGDFIDKGYAVKETIEFIYDNLHKFKIVIGNHESFVLRKLKGEIGKTDFREDKWFDSLKMLENDEDLRNKFLAICKEIVPFITNKEKTVVITHAPCENKFLRKLDSKSLKAQRNFRFARLADHPDYESWIKGISRDFSFLTKESNDLGPLHIFGHVATMSYVRHKNKICVDNGCVNGHGLTYIKITNSTQLGSMIVIPYKIDLNNPKIKQDKGLETVFFELKETKDDLSSISSL